MIPANHSHAPWRKAILIPFWVCQLGLELIMIALLALAIGVLGSYDDNDYYNSYTSWKIIGPVWLSLISTCLIFTLTEIVLLARKKMKSLTFLITNVLKSAIFAALFVIDIISAVNNASSRTASAVALVIEAALLLSFWLPLVYACIIYHRFRTGTQYKSVNNPLGNPGVGTGTEFQQYPQQGSNAPQSYNTQAYGQHLPGPYKGFTQGTPSNLEAAQPALGGGGRLSYNHARDPRFAEFRRSSRSDLGVTEGAPVPLQVPVEQPHDGHAFEMGSSSGARRDMRS